MKKLLSLFAMSIFISCTQGLPPEFAANTVSAQKILELQGSESDFQAQLDLIHEDVQWQPAFFGSSEIGKEEFGRYLKGWQDEMENVVYTATNWLPGVLAETGLADGSVRSYGIWSGTHTATGKKWQLKAYHTWDFKDGLIIGGGDYFDANGLINFLQTEVAE
jgi:hypothetical protein